MWLIIRAVVVLPLVPVTATIGTRGRRVVGPGPGSEARTVAAAEADIARIDAALAALPGA